MKKLLIIGLFAAFSTQVCALSIDSKTTIKTAIMCGNDNCPCGNKPKPGDLL